jgi:hypothetical protein
MGISFRTGAAVALIAFTGLLGQVFSCQPVGAVKSTINTANGLKVGTWGGEHAAMQVSDSGATLEFDCAHGSIPAKIELSSGGHFDTKGTFVHESFGPVRRDSPPTDRPAHFFGTVSGNEMTLKIELTEDNKKVDAGTFTLQFGVSPILRKCR